MEFLTNPNIIFYIAAYLIGGIPFGLILARFFAGVDVKSSGSQSIGATNVLRVVKERDPALAKKLAIATLTLDAFKGVAVLLVAKLTGMPDATLWAIAVLAVAGHCFSPYLMFEGGKGIATGVGVLAFIFIRTHLSGSSPSSSSTNISPTSSGCYAEKRSGLHDDSNRNTGVRNDPRYSRP